MKKIFFFSVASAVGLIFGINVALAGATCTPPVTCAVHCAGWGVPEDIATCTAACIRLNLPAEWEDNYQGCVAREKREADQAQAAVAAEAKRQAEWQAQQQAQQQSTQQSATANPPAATSPASAPASSATQYLGPKDFKVGQTYTAPADQAANIITPSQKIDLKPGSILKYIDKLTLQLVSGVAHIVEKLEKVAIAGRYKVRVAYATVSVRGTQYTVDASVPDKTTVIVTKGIVNVAPTAKGAKAIDVKEGYQLTVADKGPTPRPAKINPATLDTWYESIPAGPAFLNSSWSKQAATNRYRLECVFTSGVATATQTLTADEQKAFDDIIKPGLAIFRLKTLDLVIEKDKRLYSTMERTNLAGNRAMQLYFDAKGIYYPAEKAGTWKTFLDKNIIANLFKTIRRENFTSVFDKSTLVFTNWAGTGKNRLAVYSGALTSDGTDKVISNATGADQEAGQPVGTATIYIDEESQLWNKAELAVNVQSGKVTFPLYERCQLTYGDAVKVALPAKAQSVNAKAGLEELNKAISSVR